MSNLEKVNELITQLIRARGKEQIVQIKKEIDTIVFSYPNAEIIKGYLEWEAAVNYHYENPWVAPFPIEQELAQIYELVKFLETGAK